jgi:adenylate cyclase
MLALWVTEKPDASLRIQACQAALDVARAVDQFNRTSPKPKLPTRIGLHSGYLLLGNVGALDHYEYHPIGDIVNTATRIEGLNKYLGTRVLATEEVIHQLDRFFTRELGQFLMAGKTRPLSIHELVCPQEESSEIQRRQHEMFGRMLDAFKNRSWDEAIERAEASIGIFGKDGPSRFYQKLCEQYKEVPPDESWDGVVRTPGK